MSEQGALQQQLEPNDSLQQHPGDASATLAAHAGSTEDVITSGRGISRAALPRVWRVAVRLPQFWADSPELWLDQVEAQFSLAQITKDKTRYDFIVAHLNARYANGVRDILANPSKAHFYEHLKTEHILRLSLSKDHIVRKLHPTELAERKTSQLLLHPRSLAGNMEVQDSLPRALSLQRLPRDVQTILQAQLTLPLDQLAGITEH